MPSRSDQKLLYIELRSGHSRHRFVRRHTSEPKPTRKTDSQTKPTRLSWSLSIGAASTSSPSKSSKGRKHQSTKARGTSDMETECSETCCRAEAVRIDSGSTDALKSLEYIHDWRAATDESVHLGERKRRRGHRCRCRALQQHIFYQPLYDNSQIQNNYYEHRERRFQCSRRDFEKKADDLQRLLPELDGLSLANGHERASPPPAYSEICPRSTDTPFAGDFAELGSVPEYHSLDNEFDRHERVEDWIWH